MARSRKAKPPLNRTRIHTSMNELEIHLTERASDFPLLAQFFFKQPERPADDQLLANLTEILNDVATSGLPLFANLAQRMLTDLCRLRSVSTLNNIIDHIGRKFRMEPGTLRSRSKTQRVAFARQIAMFLGRKITGCSYPTIGEHFGRRDHSTVIYACNLIERRMADAAFRLAIEKIEREILASATTTIAAAA
jgi:chromosomal replication initiation ATPase DnaA